MNFSKRYIALGLVVLSITACANAAVLFEDNFDSYASLGDKFALPAASNGVWDTSPWGTGVAVSDVKVGALWSGVAYYSNNYWGDSAIHNAHVEAYAGLTDCEITVDALKKPGYTLEWYAMARITDTTYVVCGALCGTAGTDGSIPLYMRVKDSAGATSGDYYIGVYDANYPIKIVLTAIGENLTGTVTHKAYTKTLTKITTVTNAGAPGFGGVNPWGYGLGYFDNFKLDSATPECGDAGTIYLSTDLNKDCYVNIADLAELAKYWLNCTTPGDANCLQ